MKRLSSLLLPSLLVAGCAAALRVEVVRPLDPMVPERDGRRILVLVEGPDCERDRAELETPLKAALMEGLLERGRFDVVERPPARGERWTIPSASFHGRAVGADLVLLCRLTHFSLRSDIHHVRRYWDGSAAGEAVLIAVPSERVLRVAGEQEYLSTRAKYSAKAYARDLLLSGLGRKFFDGLFVERTGRFVELADPADGSQREGIEQAKKGDWEGAARSWKRSIAEGRSEAAARQNLRAASEASGGHEER